MGRALVAVCGNPVRDQGPSRHIDDEKYRESISGEACQACGSEHGVVGAHIRAGHDAGWRQKPSDDLIIALCALCHADQKANPGPAWWIGHILGVVVGAGLTNPGLLNLVKDMARQRYTVFRKIRPYLQRNQELRHEVCK